MCCDWIKVDGPTSMYANQFRVIASAAVAHKIRYGILPSNYCGRDARPAHVEELAAQLEREYLSTDGGKIGKRDP